MPVINPTDLQIGDKVRFKSLAPHDNVTWTGEISSICNYAIAKTFSDVYAYNQEVRKVCPEVQTADTLRYILLDVRENGAKPVTHAFALDWIDPSSLSYVVENQYTDIRIYDAEQSVVDEIVQLLAAKGFTSTVIGTSRS